MLAPHLSTPGVDNGLDPNDFPALGASPTAPHTNSAPSYASQAGTDGGGGGGGNVGAAPAVPVLMQRDFTADDFPALGAADPALCVLGEAWANANRLRRALDCLP
jgi:CCR4-NOT transcription complex subunit 2